jgi:hypothetical protein
MKIPEDILVALEEFWTEEYESDYLHFGIEKPTKVSVKTSLSSINSCAGKN